MRVRYSFSSRHTRTMDVDNKHRREFPAVVRELIGISDIILEIIDARFLQETRNLELEKLVKAQEKKLIFVINKIDLVDKSKLKKELEITGMEPYSLISCTERQVSNLKQRLKIEAKKIDRPKVHIGVIGYPNTGKSSVINSLVGRSCARVSSESGCTRGIQKIKFSDTISIFDTPGVILDEEALQKNKYNPKLVKIGVKMPNRIKEPEFFVHELVKSYPGVLEKHYQIEADGDSEKLLEELGKKKHLLRKGGEVDSDRVARMIIKDWQEGRVTSRKNQE